MPIERYTLGRWRPAGELIEVTGQSVMSLRRYVRRDAVSQWDITVDADTGRYAVYCSVNGYVGGQVAEQFPTMDAAERFVQGRLP